MVNVLMGAPPYVFPRAAIAATPVRNDSLPFIVSTPSYSALRRVESTSPPSVGVPQWLSSTLDNGEDEDDKADDGLLAGSDLKAELELRVDGGEVSSECIISEQHRLFCSSSLPADVPVELKDDLIEAHEKLAACTFFSML
jgi:hypothetical protein